MTTMQDVVVEASGRPISLREWVMPVSWHGQPMVIPVAGVPTDTGPTDTGQPAKPDRFHATAGHLAAQSAKVLGLLAVVVTGRTDAHADLNAAISRAFEQLPNTDPSSRIVIDFVAVP